MTKYGAIVGGVAAAAPVVLTGAAGVLGAKALRQAARTPQALVMRAGAAETIKSTTKFIGRGVADYSKELGKDAWNLGKFLWQNRNSRGVQLATIGTGLALMPAAYEEGERETKYQHKMQQIASNWSVSDDGGGTFLRPNFRPSIDYSVDDHGATGDLVFALHSLRHGG